MVGTEYRSYLRDFAFTCNLINMENLISNQRLRRPCFVGSALRPFGSLPWRASILCPGGTQGGCLHLPPAQALAQVWQPPGARACLPPRLRQCALRTADTAALRLSLRSGFSSARSLNGKNSEGLGIFEFCNCLKQPGMAQIPTGDGEGE